MWVKAPRSIGTERESSLHAELKYLYAGAHGKVEVPLGPYVCDVHNEYGEIIEIQTGSFGPLKDKVAYLIDRGPLKIVHPIHTLRRIELYDPAGVLLYRRKSPRRGTIWDLFSSLVYAPRLPLLPNLSVELVLLEILEKRVQDGKGSWRRRGISLGDKKIVERQGELLLRSPQDYGCFAPFEYDELFTVKDLAQKARISPTIAGKTVYVLSILGTIDRQGKRGNAWVYRRNREPSVKGG